MATLVCDKTPCDYMQAAINVLISCSSSGERFVIVAKATPDPKISFLVPLRYCPFCGTRIDPQWVRNYLSGYPFDRSFG